MGTYIVQVFTPTVYEVEAENEADAEKQARELWKSEHTEETWIEPEAKAWLRPVVYTGKSMHEQELEKKAA